MKRIASESLNRYDYPFAVPATGETRSDALADPTRQPAGMTMEQLRSLPLPPLPPGIDFTSLYEGDGDTALPEFERDGFSFENFDEDFAFWIVSLCVKRGYADAALWLLLRMKYNRIAFESAELDPQQIRYLFACLNRLPEPITLDINNESFRSGERWDTLMEELQKSNGIRGISGGFLYFSEQELEHLLAVIKDHPVIRKFDLIIDESNVAALNNYLSHNTTLRHLVLASGRDSISPATDITPALMANSTLTAVTFYGWPISPALGHLLAAPGKALARLKFVGCTFAPGTIAALASALANNNVMSHLEIDSQCKIPFEEQKSLHEGLRFNRSLVSLDLDCTRFSFARLLSMWEMLQTNLTVYKMSDGYKAQSSKVTDHLHRWSLLPQIEQRLRENKELPFLTDQYPKAKLALSILPGNLPHLPPEVSDRIASLLLQTDATALPAYRTLHMLALHKEMKKQDAPAFPEHLPFASCQLAPLLARRGTQLLPLSPDDVRSVAMFCIRHEAGNALDWLVVHASRGTLDLRGSEFAAGEAGWLIQWTRAAPCHIKLRLDNVPLSKQDIADIAEHLNGNPALTSLSLRGCAMTSGDVHLICVALKTNVVIVELLLSENLIALDWRETERSSWRTSLEGGMVVDGNRNLISVPEQASALSLEKLASYWNEMARLDLSKVIYAPPPSPRYLSLATIAFLLRRNVRMQKGVPTSDDFMPDKAFMDAIAILPDPG